MPLSKTVPSIKVHGYPDVDSHWKFLILSQCVAYCSIFESIQWHVFGLLLDFKKKKNRVHILTCWPIWNILQWCLLTGNSVTEDSFTNTTLSAHGISKCWNVERQVALVVRAWRTLGHRCHLQYTVAMERGPVDALILLFLVTFPYVSNSSTTLTLTSSWSGSILCEGYDVEMTCIIQKASGIDDNLTVSIRRNRSEGQQSSNCSVWPLPEHGIVSCSNDRHGDIRGIGVNGSKIDDVTLILLVVIERVLPQDSGTYECRAGDHGKTIPADATLNLKVSQHRSDCTVDTLSRKLYIDLADGIVGSQTLVCVHGSVPPVSTVWFQNEISLPSSIELSSGIFTASLLRTQDHSQEDVYHCSVKREKYWVILHRFERPDIQFYVTDNNVTRENLHVSINVHIASGVDLRSPLSCNFSLRPLNHRYYGARAANFQFSLVLGESSHIFLRCKARSRLGETIKSYNLSSSHFYRDDLVVVKDSPGNLLNTPTLTPAGASVSEMSNSFKSKTFASSLPEFLRTREGIVLFSILILLGVVVVVTVIVCVCKLSREYQHRRIHRSGLADGYWSRVPTDGDKSTLSIANRKLPSIPETPEDIYVPSGSSDNGSVPTPSPVVLENRTFHPADANTSGQSARIGGPPKKAQ